VRAQLGVLPPDSNTPQLVEYLLAQVPQDSVDALIVDPWSPPEVAGLPKDKVIDGRALHDAVAAALLEAICLVPRAAAEIGVGYEDESEIEPAQGGDDAAAAESAVATGGTDGGGGIATWDGGEGDEEQELRPSLAGISVNSAVKVLVLAEAQRLVQWSYTGSQQLRERAVSAARWAFENTPRSVSVSLLRNFGELVDDETVPLEIAYSCARLARRGEGLRDAAQVMRFEEVRLVEASACPDPLQGRVRRLLSMLSAAIALWEACCVRLARRS
jgi:hypothetical protein